MPSIRRSRKYKGLFFYVESIPMEVGIEMETYWRSFTGGCAVLNDFSRVWLLATTWPVARKAPLSMGFPRQEYWGGLPFPPLGNLPNPGIKPVSPALAGRFFTTEPPEKPFTGRSSIILDSVLRESKVIWSFLP